MGIWIELGLFLVALAFGVWQLRDVRKAQAERQQREREQGMRAAPAPREGQPPP